MVGLTEFRRECESAGKASADADREEREREVMSHQAKATQNDGGRVLATMWKNRLWWTLPLGVLILLLAAIYALTHLSKTDSEMYPTSSGICVALPHLG